MVDLPENLPPAVADALLRLKTDLSNTAGADLAGLILYGGLARGRYRPRASDVNVIVLLSDVTPAILTRIAPVLRAAWRAVAVEPMILTRAEAIRLAEVFPTKVQDIQENHVVLEGEDPFASIVVPDGPLRLRVEQELLNLILRLRRSYLAAIDEPESLARLLAKLARPLAIELAAILRLEGRPVPATARTATIFEAAAQELGLDGHVLARLAALRQQPDLEGDAKEFCGKVFDAMAKAIEALSTSTGR